MYLPVWTSRAGGWTPALSLLSSSGGREEEEEEAVGGLWLITSV